MKKIIRLVQILAFVAILMPFHASAFFWTIRTISEESPPLNCPDMHLVTGIECTGKYCDNIQLECSGYVNSSIDSFNTGFREWKEYISEESPRKRDCLMTEVQEYYPKSTPFYGFLTGISCRGKYCDDISLECSSVMNNGPNLEECYWSSWVSEENGGKLYFPQDDYAIGIECRGSYCDDKRFRLCPLLY